MSNKGSQKIDPCRIFVAGLDRDKTSLQSLKFYFQQYGEVIDASIARTRLIGFIKFSNNAAVRRVLNSGPHVIDGLRVSVKEAHQEADIPPRQNNMPERTQRHKSDPEVKEPNKIYLGGICIKRTTEQSLAEYFQDFGNVIGVEIKKNSAGVSRGFGFITFDSASTVKRVMNLNPHMIDAKTVDVKHAIPESNLNHQGSQPFKSTTSRQGSLLPKPFPDPTLPSRESRRGGGDDNVDPCKVFLGGLHLNTEEKDLHDYFGRFGDITDAIVMRHQGTNKSKCFGFVTYSESYMAEALLQQQEHLLNGKMISVRIPRPRDEKPSRKEPLPSPPPPPSARTFSPPSARTFSPPSARTFSPSKRATENDINSDDEHPNPPSQKTLVIGDCRVDHLKSKTHPSFFKTVDFVSLGEAKLGTIVEEMEARVRNFPYQIVIIFSISFDITLLTLCPQTNVKVMDLEQDFSLDFIMETIKSLKERWSELYRNVRFVWTLPYVPDIPRFNSIQLAKVECWNNPWADKSRMACKVQLFKCYIEGMKTRWDEDSKNIYYVDLNYVMAMEDEVQLTALRNGSLDDSIVCKAEDTVDGLNPSKLFATKFWHQVKKLEEFMSLPPTLTDSKGTAPKLQGGHNIRDTWKAPDDIPSDSSKRNNRTGGMSGREENEPRRNRPGGRPSRFSDNVPQKEEFSFKRQRQDYNQDDFNDQNKRSNFERGRKFNREESPEIIFSSKEDRWGKNFGGRPSSPKSRTLLPSPVGPYSNPFNSRERDSNRGSREGASNRDGHKRPSLLGQGNAGLLDKPAHSPFYDNQNAPPSMLQHSKSIGDTVKNAASAAIQSQLASQMEHLLPDVIKGVTEKIYSEVMKSMQTKGGWR